ncbi:MAG: hypothetical protein DI628_07305 [Blastochloris viridis]|uniref:DUF6468 domain-containing protein n=1 Tax=Blastochloris viridis TaxID=1079 RepID=A0A6N4RCB5_BLAVI|nr:MAG: hypothetical protein DI628_07305 [Blastochloris viridis]
MALYISILTVLLLALVAGLLLVLHFQLKEWRVAAREAPLLAEKLTEAILSARKGLADIKQELSGSGPELNRLIDAAGQSKVELQFLLQRAESMGDKLEQATSRRTVVTDEEDLPSVRLAPETQAVVERVASANGTAAKPLPQALQAGMGRDGDPLEELLANLQTTGVADAPVTKSPKRKRSGPVTQAELDLQQSLKGGA